MASIIFIVNWQQKETPVSIILCRKKTLELAPAVKEYIYNKKRRKKNS